MVCTCRFEALEELNRVFDEAWVAVASEDYEAGRLAAAVGRGLDDDKPRKPLTVSTLPTYDCSTANATARTHRPQGEITILKE